MRRNFWKTLALLFALLAVAGLGWLGFLVHRSGSLSGRAAQLEEDVAGLRARTQKLPAERARLAAAIRDARAVAAIMPRGEGPESLTSTIQEKAAEADVTPRWIQLRSIDNGSDFNAWRYSLFVEGSYDQLASFMNGMEQLDQFRSDNGGDDLPFFEITDLNISGSASERRQCTLVMYTYRPDGEWLKRE